MRKINFPTTFIREIDERGEQHFRVLASPDGVFIQSQFIKSDDKVTDAVADEYTYSDKFTPEEAKVIALALIQGAVSIELQRETSGGADDD